MNNMIAVTIRITMNVHYDIIKYNEEINKISKEFYDALANGLKSTYRGDWSWIALSPDVIISFGLGENRKQYGVMPEGTIIVEYVLITIITKNFDILNKYVEKAIDVIKNSPHLLFNVDVIDYEQQ